MALATRCPYCRTTFRVTHDQLKLRGGLVRCGACKEIFSGVENLLPAEPVATPVATPVSTREPRPASASGSAPGFVAGPPATAPESAPGSAPAWRAPAPEDSPDSGTAPPLQSPVTASSPLDADTSEPAAGQPPASALAPEAASEDAAVEHDSPDTTADQTPDEHPEKSEAPVEHPHEPPQDVEPPRFTPPPALPTTTPQQDLDPLTRMTLMDMRPWPKAENQASAAAHASSPSSTFTDADEIERALGELQQKPWRVSGLASDEADEIDALDNEEPDFIRQARLQAERRRKTRLFFGLGSAVLLVLALLQAAIVMRTEIAARWPASLPALSSLCNVAGCKIGLPQQIEYVTIESHELQALPNSDTGFVLSTLLRNRSKTAQAWPHLELTLNDAAEQPVARRVLTPADYLSPQERARGMQASSERPLRISFTLSQLKASGYRLYVFYP